MDKLRECPFCGNEGDIAEGQTFGFARQFQPCCRHCGLTLDIYDTLEQAISAWNTRAEQPNEPLTLDELKQMDGEPVWVKEITDKPIDGDYWGIIKLNYSAQYVRIHGDVVISPPTDGRSALGATTISYCGKTWLAYRQKPKEDD